MQARAMPGRKRDRTQPKPPPPTAPQPTRRRLALAAGVGVVALVAAAAVFFFVRSRTTQADLRPIPGQNVLLITIDTLRADAPGCYGGPAATRALDRLAAEGVRFDFAHAHAVMTLPSHASILTGAYPFEHGLRDNSGYRLPRGARTIATLLKQAGYATGAFVAAFPVHSRFGLNAGFDVYDDRFGDEHATDFNMPERPASEVVPLARTWIAEGAHRTSGRWFAWVHVFDPHAPYRPPAPFDTQYAAQPYYGEVAAVDAALAPLLDDVRQSARPTLVIVTGDHGEGLGEHGEQAHGIFAYESTLRVPLIMAELGGGGRAPRGGEVSSVAARHVDILPTILDAIGKPLPPGLRGRTLLPAAERRDGAEPRANYFEAMSGMLDHGWAPLTGVISGRDKFVDLPIAERYDLTADTREMTNLAGRVPERDRTLAATLKGFGPIMPGRRVAEDPEAAARLRALGYVSGNAPAKVAYTEDDDPKRLVDLDGAIHRAVEAATSGRGEEAARIYRQAIERRPSMAIPYRHLALLEWQQGDAAGAIGVLRDAVARGVADPRLLSQLGEYLSDAGRVAEGTAILERLAANPDADPDTLNSLGIAYARAGRGGDARRLFERLMAAMPASGAPLENLGVLALGVGDDRAARAYFDRAVALAPASSRAHAGVAEAAFREGDRNTAFEAWRRAVELDPSNLEALYNLGVNLARDGRMADARPYLIRFQQVAPPALHAEALREVSRLLQSKR
jgi:arylsulfatase A-like enzyme/Flp pilus assembly protein TadD